MSLLDDVSIVVTPNGYKAGTLFGAIPVPTLGSEDVVNGDFVTDSDWTKAQSTISNGEATIISPDGSYAGILQSNVTVAGKTYKYSLDIKSISGNLDLRIGGITNIFTTTGIKTGYVTAAGTYAEIKRGGGVLNATIDNVSIKEWVGADMDVTRATAATRVDEAGLVNYAEIVGSEEITNGDFATDTDWAKSSGWTISGGKATYDGTGGTSSISQNQQIELGKTYRVTIDVISNQGGGANTIFIGNDQANSSHLAVGTHTFLGTSTSGDGFNIYGRSGEVFEIDNVSLKEVTRDNVPRIDYSGGGCPHILAEPQRTNLVTQSSDYSGYALSSINIVSNISTSPDGSVNATSVTNTNTGQSHIRTGFTASSTGDYTGSSYIKKQDFDFIYVEFGNAYAWFNISNGTLGNSGNFGSGWTFVSHSIESVGNDWYRISITANNTIAGSYNFRPYQPSSANGSYTSGSTGTSFIWGTQLEVGSFATSLIPTSGGTVTRNQDQFSRDGIGSLINSEEGVLFVEMAAISDDLTRRKITISDGTANNFCSVYFDSASNRIIARSTVGGVLQSFMLNDSFTATNFNKIAFKWKLNDLSLWINGTKIAVDSSGTTWGSNVLTEISFDNGSGAETFYGKVKQLQVYKTALTDEQLIQLTGTSGTDFYESYAEMASALTYTIQ